MRQTLTNDQIVNFFLKIKFGNFMLKVGGWNMSIYLVLLTILRLVSCICEVEGLKEKVLVTVYFCYFD